MGLQRIVALLFIGAVLTSATAVQRIVGGNTATINQFPFIVQLEYSSSNIWSLICAGNIITNRHVLTSAQCTAGATAATRRVRTGSATHNSGGVIHYASTILNHPSYNSNTYDNDLSIIRLSSNIAYTTSTQAIGIPSQNYAIANNTAVQIAGWGTTGETYTLPSSVLRQASINIVDLTICRNRYLARPGVTRGNVTNNMICAGVLNVGGRGACSADTGGPLVYGGSLVGLISWSEGCARANYPGVFTRVSAYTSWITQNAV